MRLGIESRRLAADLRAGRRLGDPLLNGARILLWVMIAGTVMVQVAAAIGLAVGVAGAPGLPSSWADVAAIRGIDGLAVIVAMRLVQLAAGRLLAVIGSVAQGTPFVAENGERLERMGLWLLALMLVGSLAGWLGRPLSGDINGFDVTPSLDPAGVTMVLVLFVLARVFRHGTALNDDVAGTV